LKYIWIDYDSQFNNKNGEESKTVPAEEQGECQLQSVLVFRQDHIVPG